MHGLTLQAEGALGHWREPALKRRECVVSEENMPSCESWAFHPGVFEGTLRSRGPCGVVAWSLGLRQLWGQGSCGAGLATFFKHFTPQANTETWCFSFMTLKVCPNDRGEMSLSGSVSPELSRLPTGDRKSSMWSLQPSLGSPPPLHVVKIPGILPCCLD